MAFIMLDWLELLGRLPAEVWLVPPAVIIAVWLGVGLALHRARLRRYRAIAARTGLTVTPGIFKPSQVHGTFRGRALAMNAASARPEVFSLRRRWTVVTVGVKNPSSVGMKIRRKDVVDRLLRLRNIESGDREFDRRFLVNSHDTGAAVRIVSDPAVRQGLLNAYVSTVRLYSTSLNLFYAKEERDPEHAQQLFDAAVCLADAVDAIKYP
jgi:hypothetical protein